ncbi:hypothetical protein IFR09_11755 [Pseudomonas syringae]|nr:hypothetical protein [Pseudomonas syringae]MBD8801816.1 hypothetical protein [Pseudomonas syringae]MBD8811834.1 hypothetical protein [Pseudomonas syringae]
MTKSYLPSRKYPEFADPVNFKVVSWLPCDKQPANGASKCMAVISDDDLDPRLDDLLKHARSLGALSAVKLVAVEDTQLHVFLENSVSSTCFPAVEALWQQVANRDNVQIWSLAFSNVSEVLCGHSDYAHWAQAKQIIEGLIVAELAMAQAPSAWDVLTPPAAIAKTLPYLPKRLWDTFLRGTVNEVYALEGRARIAVNHATGQESLLVPEANSAGSMRERCIRELLKAGVRPLELRQMKVSHGPEMTVPTFKADQRKGRDSHRILSLSRDAAEMLARYISEGRLSEGHYLFPSERSPSEKMSNRELREMFGSSRVISTRYADERMAKIKEFQRSLLAAVGTAEWLTGHSYQDLLQHYFKDAKPYL